MIYKIFLIFAIALAFESLLFHIINKLKKEKRLGADPKQKSAILSFYKKEKKHETNYIK